MNRTLTAAAIGACLLALGTTTPAMAASGTPQRPDGPVVSSLSSVNGGDNGWGNCGHNSSGGLRPLGGGNGGFRKGDSCLSPVTSTAPTTGATSSEPTGPDYSDYPIYY